MKKIYEDEELLIVDSCKDNDVGISCASEGIYIFYDNKVKTSNYLAAFVLFDWESALAKKVFNKIVTYSIKSGIIAAEIKHCEELCKNSYDEQAKKGYRKFIRRLKKLYVYVEKTAKGEEVDEKDYRMY